MVAAAAFVVLVVVTTVVFLPPAVVVVVTVLVVMLPLATASAAVQTCPFLIWPHLEHVTGFRALPSLVGGAGAGKRGSLLVLLGAGVSLADLKEAGSTPAELLKMGFGRQVLRRDARRC